MEGEIREYSVIKEDFDSEKEFNEYLEDGHDIIYEVDFAFSGEDVESILKENGRSKLDSKTSIGVMSSVIYELSKDNI